MIWAFIPWYLIGLVLSAATAILINLMDGKHWSRGTGSEYVIAFIVGIGGPFVIIGPIILAPAFLCKITWIDKFLNTTFEPFNKGDREDGA